MTRDELKAIAKRYGMEIMANDLWDRVARFMDADTRETVHAEFAPCAKEEFLTEYLRRPPPL